MSCRICLDNPVCVHGESGAALGTQMLSEMTVREAPGHPGDQHFDRVSKQAIVDTPTDAGGPELSSHFASVKKRDLAMSADCVFAGTYTTEVEVREKALDRMPEVTRFASARPDADKPEIETHTSDTDVDTDDQSPCELAAWPRRPGGSIMRGCRHVKHFGCRRISTGIGLAPRGGEAIPT